jgi:hypothetical protein
VPAGAVFPLLVWIVLAPADVRAGCSHLVTSRDDRVLLPLFLQDVMTDRGKDPAAPGLPLSIPQSPGPCRGAWCGDGQSVPAVPVGTLRIRAESWAWNPAVPSPASLPPACLLQEAADLHPSRRAIPIFCPPRIASGA